MMKVRIFRKIVITIVILLPLFISTDCKKQAKCGCEGDVLFSLTKEPSVVNFNETGTSITFIPVSNPYKYFIFATLVKCLVNLRFQNR